VTRLASLLTALQTGPGPMGQLDGDDEEDDGPPAAMIAAHSAMSAAIGDVSDKRWVPKGASCHGTA